MVKSYSIEHLHLPLQNSMLFVKSRVGPSGYMALSHKQTFCQNLAALWVRKEFLAERMKYLEVPLLPGSLGPESGGVEISWQCEPQVLSLNLVSDKWDFCLINKGYCRR
ncbi:hypothetical protein FOXG_16440 [Fusarium oxysporum f. sp. lycopersici 4287]|uniref:Uncharacterized protein n=2 Tax=Fusarium oxysporum TaxID=5507 RepID=A0A0J9W7Z2_FUSO4|nr:hypothetical protein FOXG_16440 [Fusarium oxysporum f. sp. lycopersici 4287]KNB19319.1 hypothetical protein FOXG_16440 [Fusarium oxysporum f. sp. lycopersici 4287]